MGHRYILEEFVVEINGGHFVLAKSICKSTHVDALRVHQVYVGALTSKYSFSVEVESKESIVTDAHFLEWALDSRSRSIVWEVLHAGSHLFHPIE